jgi:hypothetical protein
MYAEALAAAKPATAPPTAPYQATNEAKQLDEIERKADQELRSLRQEHSGATLLAAVRQDVGHTAASFQQQLQCVENASVVSLQAMGDPAGPAMQKACDALIALAASLQDVRDRSMVSVRQKALNGLCQLDAAKDLQLPQALHLLNVWTPAQLAAVQSGIRVMRGATCGHAGSHADTLLGTAYQFLAAAACLLATSIDSHDKLPAAKAAVCKSTSSLHMMARLLVSSSENSLMQQRAAYMQRATSSILDRKERLLKREHRIRQLSGLGFSSDRVALSRSLASVRTSSLQSVTYVERSLPGAGASVGPASTTVNIDLGPVLEGQGSQSHTLLVHNKTGQLINLQVAAPGGGSVCEGISVRQPQMMVPAGLSSSIELVADSDAMKGSTVAPFDISCDACADLVRVTVRADCQPLLLKFDREQVDFGVRGTNNEVVEQKLLVTNGTGVPLKVKGRCVGPRTATVLAVEPHDGLALDAWQQQELVVRAELSAPDDVCATLQVSS